MTDFIAITDEETDPNAPITASLLKRFNSNHIAAMEGANGAPRLQADASKGATAGNTLIMETPPDTISGVEVSKIAMDSSFRATTWGTIRVQAIVSNISAPATAVIYKNTTIVQTGTAAIDVSYVAGDVIYLRLNAGADGGQGTPTGSITAYLRYSTGSTRINGGG